MTEIDIVPGQEVRFTKEAMAYPLNTTGSRRFHMGDIVTVRSVGDYVYFKAKRDFQSGEVIMGVDPGVVEPVEPADPNAPRPRRLGETPEGGIAPDDPRLAWLWEDAAKYADSVGHCPEYDRICDALNIPGRERNFTVKREVNGIEGSFKVKARSKALAEELVAKSLEPVS